MDRAQKAQWWWASGIGYVLLIPVVVGGLFAARNWALTEAASAKSIQQWQAWRDDVKRQQSQRGPVQRRVPKSLEPPALVLMRDYFAVCLAGSILFSSLLYWVVVWFIQGILAGQ